MEPSGAATGGGGSGSSTTDPPPTTEQSSSAKIDELLQSGQISNAIEFYNYFRNKSSVTYSASLTTQPHSTLNNILDSSPSNPQTQIIPLQQPPPPPKQRPLGSKKSNKTNTLSDYANILQSNNVNSNQIQPTQTPPANYRGTKSKKSPHMHSSSSSLALYNTPNCSINPVMPSLSGVVHHVIPTISIPTNLFALTTGNNSTPPRTSGGSQKGSRPFSLYAFTPQLIPTLPPQLSRSPSQSFSNLNQTQPAKSIYNQYLIDGSNPTQTQNENIPPVLSSNVSENNAPEGSAQTTASLSSMFLNSTSYYQKYKQQQLQKTTAAAAASLMQSGGVGCGGEDEWDLEKRREDAVNRIIRNEKIKQIRMKIYENELLKEYQQNFPTNSSASTTTTSALESGAQDVVMKPSSRANLRKTAQQNSNNSAAKINTYFSRTYGGENTIYSNIPNNNRVLANTTFDEYKSSPNNSGSGDESKLIVIDEMMMPSMESAESTSIDFLDLDVDEQQHQEDLLNEENYESGIEDDENSSTSSYFHYSSPKLGKQQTPKQQKCQKSSNSTSSSSSCNKSTLKNPGANINVAYDVYRLNVDNNTTSSSSLATSSSFISNPVSANSSNSNLFINLYSSAAQSTFQLKISIISAEVKNIVNVLKQV